ncbi:MAG: hypothetical protein IJ296_03070 [Bacteroidales bacterium]|nr:hypothetical protein [Bacteroidales bacterium]
MYINTTGYYIPQERVYNSHFFELNGLDSGWIEQRTGIKSRSKARPYENINTMSLEAVRNAIPELGNTGSVSSALVYAQNAKKFKEGDLVAMTVFGGGYSTGACLISIG